MFKRLIVLTLLGFTLLGCRSAERSAAEEDKVAHVLGDFIAFRKALPNDIAALQTFADGGGYKMHWQRFTRISFFPISSNGVRVEFLDVAGRADYRTIYISARGLSPLVSSGTTDTTDPKAMTDPKAIFMFFH
jgi:hypothetical protein